MTSHGQFTEIAALAGDPARAGMLHALLGGRALTATELASVAGVTPQTASGHLARLTAVDLVSVMKQGRHRYYRLASPAVARMMEAIMEVASDQQPPGRGWSSDRATPPCAPPASATIIWPAASASPSPMHWLRMAMPSSPRKAASSPRAACGS